MFLRFAGGLLDDFAQWKPCRRQVDNLLGTLGDPREFKTTVSSFTFWFEWNARYLENSLEGCWMLCVMEVVRAAGLQPSWDLLELTKTSTKRRHQHQPAVIQHTHRIRRYVKTEQVISMPCTSCQQPGLPDRNDLSIHDQICIYVY